MAAIFIFLTKHFAGPELFVFDIRGHVTTFLYCCFFQAVVQALALFFDMQMSVMKTAADSLSDLLTTEVFGRKLNTYVTSQNTSLTVPIKPKLTPQNTSPTPPIKPKPRVELFKQQTSPQDLQRKLAGVKDDVNQEEQIQNGK